MGLRAVFKHKNILLLYHVCLKYININIIKCERSLQKCQNKRIAEFFQHCQTSYGQLPCTTATSQKGQDGYNGSQVLSENVIYVKDNVYQIACHFCKIAASYVRMNRKYQMDCDVPHRPQHIFHQKDEPK